MTSPRSSPVRRPSVSFWTGFAPQAVALAIVVPLFVTAVVGLVFFPFLFNPFILLFVLMYAAGLAVAPAILMAATMRSWRNANGMPVHLIASWFALAVCVAQGTRLLAGLAFGDIAAQERASEGSILDYARLVQPWVWAILAGGVMAIASAWSTRRAGPAWFTFFGTTLAAWGADVPGVRIFGLGTTFGLVRTTCLCIVGFVGALAYDLTEPDAVHERAARARAVAA